VVVVTYVAVGEEDREHVAGPGQAVRYARFAQRLVDHGGDGVRRPVELVVYVPGGPSQRRQPGGARQRIPRQRAGLVDPTGRRQALHDRRAAAEGRRRQATAHDLAERVEIGIDLVDRRPAAAGDPEAGHHLVDDQQCAMAVRDLDQLLVEALTWGDDTHVAGG